MKNANIMHTTNENILEKKKHLVKLEQENRELSNELKRLMIQQNELTNSQRMYSSHDNDLFYNRYSSMSRESTPFALATHVNPNSLQASKSILAAVNLLNSTTTAPQQLLNSQSHDPYLLAELKSLKKYTDNLDNRMNHLEQNRYELINQLTHLKKVRDFDS
jgi:hypothetical protein